MSPTSRPVTFLSPGPDAYRLRVVGQSPSDVYSALLIGSQGIATFQLPFGTYAAHFEPLEASIETTQAFDVFEGDGPLSVLLADQTQMASRVKRLRPQTSIGFSPLSFGTVFDDDAGSRPELQLDVELGMASAIGRHLADPPLVTVVEETTAGQELILRLQIPDEERYLHRHPFVISSNGAKIAVRGVMPWFVGGTEVQITRRLPGAIAVAVTPSDPGTKLLLAGLERGSPSERTQIAEQSAPDGVTSAIEYLSEKKRDPWAAVAAAYLLLRTPAFASVRPWILNLGMMFSWMPDASILATWAQIASANEDSEELDRVCLEEVCAARALGAPYFRITLLVALELLNTLTVSASTPELQRRAGKEAKVWQRKLKSASPTETLYLRVHRSASAVPSQYRRIYFGTVVEEVRDH